MRWQYSVRFDSTLLFCCCRPACGSYATDLDCLSLRFDCPHKNSRRSYERPRKIATSKSVDSIQRSRFFSDSNLPRLLECWAQVRTLLLLWEKKTIGSKLGYGKILRQQLLKSWTQFIFITEIDKSVRVVRGLQILAPKSNERITLSVNSIFLKQARVSTKNYRRSRKNNANVQVNLCRYHAL